MVDFKDFVRSGGQTNIPGLPKLKTESGEYAAELLSKLALGMITAKDVKARIAQLQNEELQSGLKLGDVEREQARLNKVIDLCEGETAMPFDNKYTVLKMRGLIRDEFVQVKDPEHQKFNAIAGFKAAIWFDFRKLAATSNKEMAEFGRELVAEGIAKLPFPECVFVFSFRSKNDEKAQAAFYLLQEDRKIVCRSIFFFIDGKPIGLTGLEDAHHDAIFYAIAVLASKSSQREHRALETGKPLQGDFTLYKGVQYVEVTIAQKHFDAGGGRSHASPRLHWRRGHVRRYQNKTTWIEATLVGKSDAGFVVHDYKV